MCELSTQLFKCYQQPTSPSRGDQTQLINQIVEYICTQYDIVGGINQSIRVLQAKLEDADLDPNIGVGEDIYQTLEGSIFKGGPSLLTEYLFSNEEDILYKMSKSYWEFRQQSWYKQVFRYQEFRSYDKFMESEYKELKQIWDAKWHEEFDKI